MKIIIAILTLAVTTAAYSQTNSPLPGLLAPATNEVWRPVTTTQKVIYAPEFGGQACRYVGRATRVVVVDRAVTDAETYGAEWELAGILYAYSATPPNGAGCDPTGNSLENYRRLVAWSQTLTNSTLAEGVKVDADRASFLFQWLNREYLTQAKRLNLDTLPWAFTGRRYLTNAVPVSVYRKGN